MKTSCINPWLALVLSSCALPPLTACGQSGKDGSGGGAGDTAGAAGGSSSGAGASGTGGSPELGGAGGGSAKGSCDELSCPDLGTCSLKHEASGCTRICSFTATYSITTAADVAQLAALQCNVVEGALQIGGAKIDSLAGLESIHEITGNLEMGGSLPDLGGLKGLEKVGGTLRVDSVVNLNSFELPILKSVGAQVYFVADGALRVKSLETIRLPALERVGTGPNDELTIVQWADLTHVYMDALKSVTGILNVDYNDELLTLNGLPSLTSARGLSVLLNPKLPQCEMDAIGARIGHPCSSSSCTGNDTTATCK